MKARIRENGQIVDVCLDDSIRDSEGTRAYYKEIGADTDSVWSENALDFYDIIDWEQRRYEIAKEILPTIQSVNSQVGFRCGKVSPDRDVVETAIRFADELIKQLKGGKE